MLHEGYCISSWCLFPTSMLDDMPGAGTSLDWDACKLSTLYIPIYI